MDIAAQCELEQHFEYREGKLYWSLPRQKIRVGDEAGTVNKAGYKVVRFKYKLYLVHRIIWILHNGPIPDGYSIDHQDGDRLNNSIENLRLAVHHQNMSNVGKSAANTTGYKGVSFAKNVGKYEARIKCKGVQYVLGYFLSPEEAHAAYCNAAEELHGKFAKTA